MVVVGILQLVLNDSVGASLSILRQYVKRETADSRFLFHQFKRKSGGLIEQFHVFSQPWGKIRCFVGPHRTQIRYLGHGTQFCFNSHIVSPNLFENVSKPETLESFLHILC